MKEEGFWCYLFHDQAFGHGPSSGSLPHLIHNTSLNKPNTSSKREAHGEVQTTRGTQREADDETHTARGTTTPRVYVSKERESQIRHKSDLAPFGFANGQERRKAHLLRALKRKWIVS